MGDSCNQEIRVVWIRRLVVEVERNGHIFELVTIGFANELNVWNERIKDDFSGREHL